MADLYNMKNLTSAIVFDQASRPPRLDILMTDLSRNYVPYPALEIILYGPFEALLSATNFVSLTVYSMTIKRFMHSLGLLGCKCPPAAMRTLTLYDQPRRPKWTHSVRTLCQAILSLLASRMFRLLGCPSAVYPARAFPQVSISDPGKWPLVIAVQYTCSYCISSGDTLTLCIMRNI